ncbi:MAG: aspartyl protease family protein [Tepidiformaceae bacterium]
MGSYIRLPSREESGVGSVFTEITVTNKRDEILAEAGHLPPASVRRVRVPNVLVDTGATTLCLPRSVIVELGLPLKRKIMAATASGEIETELYEQAELTVAGRTGTVECVALPDGSQPLLGVIPLEMLGLEPDLTKHNLRVLPADTKDSYFFV